MSMDVFRIDAIAMVSFLLFLHGFLRKNEKNQPLQASKPLPTHPHISPFIFYLRLPHFPTPHVTAEANPYVNISMGEGEARRNF